MLLKNERAAVADYGRKMLAARLTTGCGGNISVLNRTEGLVAIKPSGLEYESTGPEDIVVVSMDGKVVEGKWKPSSELNFHLALYRSRPDVNAVVHTHSVYATTIACLNWELPAVHYLVGYAGNKVPLAPYATFGTNQLAENVVRSIGAYNAVLLANHGLIAVGKSLHAAFTVAEEIELVAQVYYQACTAGRPVIIEEEEMRTVVQKFGTYGQQPGA